MHDSKDQQDWWNEFRNLYHFSVLDKLSDPEAQLRGIVLICDYIERILGAHEAAEKSGETQLVSRGLYPSEGLINWLIFWFIDDLVEYRLPMPAELGDLILRRLPGINHGFPLMKGELETRSQAEELMGSGQHSYRGIAKRLGVNVSTISRWANSGSMEKLESDRINHPSIQYQEIWDEYDLSTNEIRGPKP